MKFETYKAQDGEFRWRIREDSGQIVSVKPGKIKGLSGSSLKKKTSERVVSLSLKRVAANGRSTEKSRPRGGKLKSAKA